MKRKKAKAKKSKPDAIALLEADHLRVHALFERYREMARTHAPAPERRALAEEICQELSILDQLEKELFYPAVREVLRDDDLVDEAEEEHGSVCEFITQIRAGSPQDALYDAKVTVLAEYVERHVRQEREEVFHRMQTSRLDLKSLGASIVSREAQLRAAGAA